MNKLTSSLQESLLTLLVTNSKEGKIVASMVSAEHFEQPYAEIAERALVYHKRFGRAPGKEHIDDIFDDVLNAKDPKKRAQATVYEKILLGIIEQADGINAEYVLSRVNQFTRVQTIKGALKDAGHRLIQGSDDGVLEDLQGILGKALKTPIEAPDSGVFLSDKAQVMEALLAPAAFYSTGIKQLDAIDFGPAKGELMVFMGAKGFGKSFFCIHQGRTAMMAGAKVLHVTLEMSRDLIIKRYFQSFFHIAKRKDKFNEAKFMFDELGRLSGIDIESHRARRSWADSDIKRFIAAKQDDWGIRFRRLCIKQFPSGYLTVDRLNAYLDQLEMHHKFVPDLIIVDYPTLMKQDSDNLRISLGQTFVDLRGLCGQRQLAGLAPTQTNREGWDARHISGKHVGEDASIFMTADIGLIGMRTKQEKALGLARLYVEKNRNDLDGQTILISQNYATGQFVTNSARMTDQYDDMVNDLSGTKTKASEGKKDG